MAKFTQIAILTAFQEMLEKMPFDKITVSAIVAKCEISPNTFYYHYRDIYDLLDVWLRQVQEKYRRQVREGSQGWQNAFKTLLLDMKANPKVVYHLFNSLSRERLERYLYTAATPVFFSIVKWKAGDSGIPDVFLQEIAEYNSYSFIGFFLKFLWNHMSDDVDSAVDRICFIFESNIQWAIDQYQAEQAQG